MDGIPGEILCPRTVIALVNLKEVHELFTPHLIYDKAKEPRTGNSTLARVYHDEEPRFEVLSVDLGQPFPKKKERKAAAVEGYVPPGILKSYWLTKHTSQLPAVMAVLFRWDDEGNRQTQETNILTQVNVIKYNHRTRNIKYLIVLVQKKKPSSSDTTAEERLASLRKHADLEPRNVAVVSLDHLADSMPKLRKQLDDLAALYFKEESQRVEKAMRRLNKETQRALCVRYCFKMAVFHEFKRDGEGRRDLDGAIKYYREAYDNLINMRHPLHRLREFKTIAEMLNFKVVQLQLALQTSPEAHFEKHMKTYASYTGEPRRFFEHYAWLTRQYTIMAELLEGAPDLAKACGTQRDAGFHYEAALRAAMERRRWADKLCRSPEAIEATKAAEASEAPAGQPQPPMFVGQQQASTQGAQGAQGSDADAEVLEAVIQERAVDHNALVRGLLDRALNFAKGRGAVRMQQQISFRMGHELYQAGLYSKAKHVLDTVAASYRQEKWWQLLTPVVNTASLCAWHMGRVEDYIQDTFELISDRMMDTADQKRKMQDAVMQIIHNPAKFATVFKNLESQFPVEFDVDASFPLVELLVQWQSGCMRLHDATSFTVSITVHASHPLDFALLEVVFSDPSLNTTYSLDGVSSFTMAPGVERRFVFEMQMDQVQKVTCSGVSLHVGQTAERVKLKWNLREPAPRSKWEEGTLMRQLQHLGNTASSAKAALTEIPLTTQLVERPAVNVLRPDAQLTVEVVHKAPALVGEWYIVDINMASHEDTVSAGYIELELTTAQRGGELPQFFTAAREPLPPKVEIAAMQPNSTQTVQLYTRCAVDTTKTYVVKVSYDTPQGFSLSCTQQLQLSFQPPLRTHIRFLAAASSQVVKPIQLGQHPAPVAALLPGKPVLVFVDLESTCDHPLCVWKVEPQLVDTMAGSTVTAISDTQSIGTSFFKGDTFTMCFELTPKESTNGALMGNIAVQLSRADVSSDAVEAHCESVFPLQAVVENPPPFTLQAHALPTLVCGESAELCYTLVNHSSSPQEFRVTMQVTEHFVVAGVTASAVQVLPGSEHVFSFTIIPISTGTLRIPQLLMQPIAVAVNDEPYVCSIQQLVDLSLPGRRTCFVRPQQLE